MDEWVQIILGAAGVLGIAEAIKWRFAPRVLKSRAQADTDAAISMAVEKALSVKDSVIKSLCDDVDRLERAVSKLQQQVATQDRSLRAYVGRIKAALERHIASWRAAVMQTDVDPLTQDRIISRVEPLPAGWDREDLEG